MESERCNGRVPSIYLPPRILQTTCYPYGGTPRAIAPTTASTIVLTIASTIVTEQFFDIDGIPFVFLHYISIHTHPMVLLVALRLQNSTRGLGWWLGHSAVYASSPETNSLVLLRLPSSNVRHERLR